MRWIGIASLASFGAVGLLVGIRLLALARRTRQLPELSIGAGLLLVSAVGFPVSAAGRLPGLVATPLGDGLLAAGLVAVCAGITLLYTFTWRVFRAEARWARVAVGAAALALAAASAGLVHASGRAETLPEILPLTRPYAAAIIALVALCFAWSGAESASYYARVRRRVALDLADPIVANRFLLWAVAGFAAAALCSALLGFLLAGRVILRDPVALATVAASGAVSSAAWSLTFFPPARYRRFVRARAARRSA